MRPEILWPLFAEVGSLPGVGPTVSSHLKRLAGPKILDLCWHVPTQIQRRWDVKILDQAPLGQKVTVKVTIQGHYPPGGSLSSKRPYRVRCSHDHGGSLELIFFRGQRAYLEKKIPPGLHCVVSGTIDHYQGKKIMTHPDHMGPLETYAQWVGWEPVYPLTYGLTNSMIRRFVGKALERCVPLPEWIDASLMLKESWDPWHQCLQRLHHPQGPQDLEAQALHRRRLAYDEFLAHQVALQMIRQHQEVLRKTPLTYSLEKRHNVLQGLHFSLTPDQEKVLEAVDQDMGSQRPMIRLLQGDVGSGKTIVAFLTLLNGISAGTQGAFMAPTEILARQHLATLEPWAQLAGIRIACLTGSDSPSVRKKILQDLAQGTLDLLVGTHVLIQEDIHFKNLQVAVIDEQHRFGVEQRLKLVRKGQETDLLCLSATPIPRTLRMTAYGDLDISLLHNKPAGRGQIQTRLMNLERLSEVVQGVQRVLAKNQKVYWVCPLIQESEALDLAAVQDRHHYLSSVLKESSVGLLHGRMPSEEKEKILYDFLQGPCGVLVSTTVIEVGIHVPQATVMVIEHAERFGLAQLHQLRGRVGRSSASSSCILLYQNPLSTVARHRLQIMRHTQDGFVIAEEDLKLRGGGDVLSFKQSGVPPLKIADYFLHQDLLEHAQKEAQKILKKDPHLLSPEGKNLRILLYLFERDQMIYHLKGG